METKKRKQLESAGWRVGSAGDFLGLSESEEALVEMRLSMSSLVRERRTRRHLTQQRLAKLLNSSQSRVAKIEAADPSVSLDLLMRAAFAVGASRAQVARAITKKRVG